MKGFIATRGSESGVATVMHIEVARILRLIENGQAAPGEHHLHVLAQAL